MHVVPVSKSKSNDGQGSKRAMRGQGSTEYIIVLALVLTLVLVTFSVLGFFSGFSEGARADESQSYWAGAARPFVLADWKFSSSPAKLYLIVQNKAGSPLNLTSLNFTSKYTNLTLDSGLPAMLQPGETINISYSSFPACQPDKVYEFEAAAGYKTSTVSGLLQKGSKPVMVRCTS